MDNLLEAKKRLVLNVSSNGLSILINAVIGLWLIPYLIKNLGVEVYGVVPLSTSVTQYFSLLTLAITATVGRFIAVSYAKQDYQTCEKYYSTSFFFLAALSFILIFIAFGVTVFLTNIFNIPEGIEFQSQMLFLLVICSTIVTALTSPFQVSTFIKHRFDLQNISKIMGKLLQVVVIVSTFYFLRPQLGYVGTSYLSMALCILIFSIFYASKLTPEFKLSFSSFDKSCLKDMFGMGVWTTIDQLGSLLYYSIDMVVINVFISSQQCGRYAPVVQWSILLNMLCGAVSGVLTPIFYEMIGKDNKEQLIRQLQRALRLMSLLMLLPISLLCGLSKPLLERWLGNDFGDLNLLMWIIIAPASINTMIMPMFAIFRGKNKVRLPAIATIIGGGSNLILSSILVNTKLGIYGVAIATAICLLARNFIFIPIYITKIIQLRKAFLYNPILKSILFFILFSSISLLASNYYNLATYPKLILTSAIVSLAYVPLAIFLLLNKEDRFFLIQLISDKRKRF